MFHPSVEALRSKVSTAAPGIPTDFLLAWIQIESEGDVHSTGDAAGGEWGLFQMSAAEATDLNIPIPELIASGSDVDKSIELGLKLVRSKIELADELLAQHDARWTGPDYGALVKAMHALPAFWHDAFASYAEAHGSAPSSFDEVTAWGLAHVHRWDAYDPPKCAKNAKFVGQYWPRFQSFSFIGGLLLFVVFLLSRRFA